VRHPRFLVPDVQLHIGQATHKVQVSTQDPAWQDPREMGGHLELNRSRPQVDETAPARQVSYVVSALDRAHHESPPSWPARVSR